MATRAEVVAALKALAEKLHAESPGPELNAVIQHIAHYGADDRACLDAVSSRLAYLHRSGRVLARFSVKTLLQLWAQSSVPGTGAGARIQGADTVVVSTGLLLGIVQRLGWEAELLSAGLGIGVGVPVPVPVPVSRLAVFRTLSQSASGSGSSVVRAVSLLLLESVSACGPWSWAPLVSSLRRAWDLGPELIDWAVQAQVPNVAGSQSGSESVSGFGGSVNAVLCGLGRVLAVEHMRLGHMSATTPATTHSSWTLPALSRLLDRLSTTIPSPSALPRSHIHSVCSAAATDRPAGLGPDADAYCPTAVDFWASRGGVSGVEAKDAGVGVGTDAQSRPGPDTAPAPVPVPAFATRAEIDYSIAALALTSASGHTARAMRSSVIAAYTASSQSMQIYFRHALNVDMGVAAEAASIIRMPCDGDGDDDDGAEFRTVLAGAVEGCENDERWTRQLMYWGLVAPKRTVQGIVDQACAFEGHAVLYAWLTGRIGVSVKCPFAEYQCQCGMGELLFDSISRAVEARSGTGTGTGTGLVAFVTELVSPKPKPKQPQSHSLCSTALAHASAVLPLDPQRLLSFLLQGLDSNQAQAPAQAQAQAQVLLMKMLVGLCNVWLPVSSQAEAESKARCAAFGGCPWVCSHPRLLAVLAGLSQRCRDNLEFAMLEMVTPLLTRVALCQDQGQGQGQGSGLDAGVETDWETRALIHAAASGSDAGHAYEYLSELPEWVVGIIVGNGRMDSFDTAVAVGDADADAEGEELVAGTMWLLHWLRACSTLQPHKPLDVDLLGTVVRRYATFVRGRQGLGRAARHCLMQALGWVGESCTDTEMRWLLSDCALLFCMHGGAELYGRGDGSDGLGCLHVPSHSHAIDVGLDLGLGLDTTRRLIAMELVADAVTMDESTVESGIDSDADGGVGVGESINLAQRRRAARLALSALQRLTLAPVHAKAHSQARILKTRALCLCCRFALSPLYQIQVQAPEAEAAAAAADVATLALEMAGGLELDDGAKDETSDIGRGNGGGSTCFDCVREHLSQDTLFCVCAAYGVYHY